MSTPAFSTLVVGPIAVNCYLVPGAKSGTLYLIDPGDDAADILDAAAAFRCPEAVILLTHAHRDHIGACGEVAKQLGVKTVCLHPADRAIYSSPDNYLPPYLPPAVNLPETMPYYEQADFTVLHTPGHTPGGVCLWFKDCQALFCGDTLFRGSIGRTDLPGGDYDALMRSIREKLLPLPDDLNLYPGHMGPSAIGVEKRCNPFLV